MLDDLEKLPKGSRFYKCAFQVNTFDYVTRHNHQTDFADEDAYNKALIKSCLDLGIEAIAITDHYRIKSGEKLAAAARAAGIVVFPGFEAVTREGIHVLCLFDPAAPIDTVQARIGACGIGNEDDDSPLGELTAEELLNNSFEMGNAIHRRAHRERRGLVQGVAGRPRAHCDMAERRIGSLRHTGSGWRRPGKPPADPPQ